MDTANSFEFYADMLSMMDKLGNAISCLNLKKVPPPEVYNCNIYGSIEDFLFIFEKFCLSVYGDDELSWLQVLPSFLIGEPKQIVLSFGLGRNVDYRRVRDRLVWELDQSGLQDRYYHAFCEATKSSSESFSCYSIRLEVLIGRAAYLAKDIQRFLVISKFLSCLPEEILNIVVIEVANKDDVTIKELVRLVNSICSTENFEFSRIDHDKVKSKQLVIKREYSNSKGRCFRCKLMGHFKVNCTARIFYCKFCKQHHHKDVECLEVSWVNGNFLSEKYLQYNRLSSSDCDVLPLVYNGKRSDIASCKDSSIGKESQFDTTMGIKWDKLKNVPFIESLGTTVNSSSDLGQSYTPPLVNTDIEWWDWEEQSICSASDSSSIGDSFAIDNDVDLFPCIDSDSGVSSMNMLK